MYQKLIFVAGLISLALTGPLFGQIHGSSKTSPAPTGRVLNLEDLISRQELEEELALKLKKVQTFLESQHLDAVVLSRSTNFSWFTAGKGDNHIVQTSETGPASLLVMRDGHKYLIASHTEIAHLMDEDLKGLGFESRGFEWHESTSAVDPKIALIQSLVPSHRIGTDLAMGDFKVLEADFATLRYELSKSEIKKYRWVCQRSTEAVAATCRLIQPGMTERQIEAVASNELMIRGLRATLILIAADERNTKYFHYPVTDKVLEHYAFVNVCARRWGLVSSVARYVYFGKIPDRLEKAMLASAVICAHMEAGSKPGLKAAEMFDETKTWFAQSGYPDYWKLTHVGGGIGYVERDWLASDESTQVIHENQGLAWNPFTRGALSFDTIIAHDAGMDNLSTTADWPAYHIPVDGRLYTMPRILVRPIKN